MPNKILTNPADNTQIYTLKVLTRITFDLYIKIIESRISLDLNIYNPQSQLSTGRLLTNIHTTRKQKNSPYFG